MNSNTLFGKPKSSLIDCMLCFFGFHYQPSFNKKLGAREEETVLWEMKRLGLRRGKGIALTKWQTGSSVCIWAGGGGVCGVGVELGASQLFSLTTG